MFSNDFLNPNFDSSPNPPDLWNSQGFFEMLNRIEKEQREWEESEELRLEQLEKKFESNSSAPRYVNILNHIRVCYETGKCSHCHPHKGMDIRNRFPKRSWKQYRKQQWKIPQPQVRITDIDIDESDDQEFDILNILEEQNDFI